MMTDIKNGFIITYHKSSPNSDDMLRDTLNALSQMNIYIVLCSHSYDVPTDIIALCDFYIYQQLNIVDNRKYSHGVAESNLIELGLQHLKWKGFSWTFKTCYDVSIKDVIPLYDWIKNYEYYLVTCHWGDCYVGIHSFFANVGFLLNNIKFYRNIDDMFNDSNILEKCWEKSIESGSFKNKIYSYKDKKSFFGDNNIMDIVAYKYDDFSFWYSIDENKFYCTNNGNDFVGNVMIFDYYSDLCVYRIDNFVHNSGITMWFVPPFQDSIKLSKNGWYIEYHYKNHKVRVNYGIKDFEYREPLIKSFNTFRHSKDMKYHEYSELSEFDLYKNDNFDLSLKNVRNYVDLGANFGFGSVYFIRNKIKCYLIDADHYNVEILNNAYSKNSLVKIYPYAVCDKDGIVDFYSDESASVVSSLFYLDANGVYLEGRKKTEVEGITPNTLIDKYIDEDYIDLMKIDIEGSEYSFFETISDINLKKISKMIIEFHNNENFKVMDILTKLSKNDFKFKLDKWGSFTDPFIVGNKMGVIYAWR